MSFERPCLVFADNSGNIYDDPDLHMIAMDRNGFSLPRPDDLIPLPDECQLFLLPHRHPLGLEPDTGEVVEYEEGLAVAALLPPTLIAAGLPAFSSSNGNTLPKYAYAAVGFAHDRFYVCARRIDTDMRHSFTNISQKKIKKAGNALKVQFPQNRLIAHIVDNCAFSCQCTAAKNFCLGRYEAFVPASTASCASLVASLSGSLTGGSASSGVCTFLPGQRPSQSPTVPPEFQPTSGEIAEVMLSHASRTVNPIISFGLDCNEHSLTDISQFLNALEMFKEKEGKATTTLNIGSAVSSEDISSLSDAELTSITLYTNSHGELLTKSGQDGSDSVSAFLPILETARAKKLSIGIRYAFFPGINDCEEELDYLISLINEYSASSLQLVSRHLDPEKHIHEMAGLETGPIVGLGNFLRRIKKNCPAVQLVSGNPFYPVG